jgi:hypothetical protein
MALELYLIQYLVSKRRHKNTQIDDPNAKYIVAFKGTHDVYFKPNLQ